MGIGRASKVENKKLSGDSERMVHASFARIFTTKRSRPVTYGIAVLATLVATLLRLALTPLIGDYAIPFITFFPAVLFSAWYGGFGAGAVTILLSTVAAAYFFS